MILKIGRSQNVACGCRDNPPKNWVWEYVEKISSVIVNSHETPAINNSDLCEVTDVNYFTNSNRDSVDNELIASVALSGADCCYLMNDEGKTIERIR